MNISLPSLAKPCLALAIGVSAAISAFAEKPNIVMILSDDQTWTDYGFMGHEHIRTPNLDRLAESGVVYRRAYVPTPLCRPSLMTLATGHYSKDHKITGNDPSPKLAAVRSPEHIELSRQMLENIDRLDTLPKILSRNGYLTHQSGKWWEGSYQRGGFTHGMTGGDTGGLLRHGDKGLEIGREGMEPIFDFIERAESDNKPFYIWYAPFLPHTPHNPPERILKRYETLGLDPALAKYYAMCEWFDETCGELIDHLEERGLRDNTLIYYVCDNGWIQKTEDTVVPEGWFTQFAPKSKQSVYDGGARQPIILSWPNQLKPGVRDELVSSIDLFPTVLSAAGVETPDGLPGIDLLPNAREAKRIGRDIIFGDSYAHDIVDLDNPEASLMYLWCIRDRWKLILSYDGEVNRYAVVHPRDEAIQLFDILADPFEEENLAKRHPEVVSELKDEIENWYPLTQRKLVSRN
ncbi:sulfatase [Pelagicoccus sp. NFK12]|uniref:Sulfatase n=1 Tax=Pelagicoccus enzymogenes TaxID=2773457 RepID=A0A927FAP6_9BACT|nr:MULTISPECIES: sulfatase [Pelagicoccus]MBD5781607.1 sulfatase [Pelagicoccus enzymogenes]MDQ8181127.1 sulfatase [Pelagicoccus sp. SDUM812005]